MNEFDKINDCFFSLGTSAATMPTVNYMTSCSSIISTVEPRAYFL